MVSENEGAYLLQSNEAGIDPPLWDRDIYLEYNNCAVYGIVHTIHEVSGSEIDSLFFLHLINTVSIITEYITNDDSFW